ncbi:MAG: phosphodiester glycosidase family protein [Acidaminococcus intestini]
MNIKQIGRTLTIALLASLMAGSAMAATISDLRGGVKDTRARLVMDIDETMHYEERAQGRTLTLTFDAKTDRTRSVRVRDRRVKNAVLAPLGKRAVLSSPSGKVYRTTRSFSLRSQAAWSLIFRQRAKAARNPPKTGENLGKGVTYRKSRVNLGAGNVDTYVLTIAPDSAYELQFVPGYGHTIQKGTLSMISRRSGAKALVNASYFDSDIWVVGNLKIRGKWLGMEETPRTGLVLEEKGKAAILPRLSFTGTVTRPDGAEMKITGLNRMRLENDLIFYNNGYDDTTDTNAAGVEVAIRNGRVIKTGTTGSMPMSWNMTVLSGHGTAADFLRPLAVGDKVKIKTSLGSPLADKAPSVGTAGPLLVYDGLVNVTASLEEIPSDIADGRAPRTAVGIKKDGTILVVVADGRSSRSAGMTLPELARYLIQLGADRAMNFDGGGSSEMVVNGAVKNRPSDGAERPVRVALGLFPR